MKKTVKGLEVKTSLEASKEIVKALDENTSYVVIKGVVSDNLIEDIMKSTNLYKNVTFLAEDGTKIFLSKDTLYKFQSREELLRL